MESSKQEIVQTVVNNPELLNEVISTQEAQTVLIQRAEMSFHQGPLPSPKSVAEYAQTIPDFGERIMAYMEKEQAARRDLASPIGYIKPHGFVVWLYCFVCHYWLLHFSCLSWLCAGCRVGYGGGAGCGGGDVCYWQT